MNAWNRRRPLLAMVVLLTLLAGCGAPAASTSPDGASAGPKQKLVVSGFGGGWEKAMRATVIEPFEQKYNVEITLALPGASTQILAKLRAEKGNPSMDAVIIGGGLEDVAAQEGLMEELNYANIPNAQDLHPDAKGPAGYGPSIAFSGIGIAYNTEKLTTPPTSWMDFWKPELKNHIGINNMDGNFGLAHFSLVNKALGGSVDNAEPGFEKFKELMTNNPLILKNTDDAVTALTQRDAWMVVMTNSRVIQMAQEGFPVKMVYPQEGGFAWGNYIGIPKGSKNKELAEQFINFYLDPEVQSQWATAVGYGPTNVKAQLPADYAYADTLQVDNIYQLDWAAINEHRAEWIERWNKEVLPLLQ